MSSGDQPPKTTFVFDACVSPKVVEILNLVQKDDIVVHMFTLEGFGRDDEDVVWIPKVAALGPVLVTCDNAQRRKVVERVLREQVKIRTVFLPGGFADLDRWGHAKWIPAVVRAADPSRCRRTIQSSGESSENTTPAPSWSPEGGRLPQRFRFSAREGT